MKLTHEKMLELTAKMPMKQISIPDIALVGCAIPKGAFNVRHDNDVFHFENPYLHRYYAGTFKDGKDLWLHNFRSQDSERHLHSHPFEFDTIMLVGNYTEEYRRGMDGEIITRYTTPCEFRSLDVSLERLLQKLASPIKEAAPLSQILLGLAGEFLSVDAFDWHRITHTAPDTWTAVIVDPLRLPYWYFMGEQSDIEQVVSSPRQWHSKYNCRPLNGVVIGDNRKAA